MTNDPARARSKRKPVAAVLAILLAVAAVMLYRNPFESKETREQREFEVREKREAREKREFEAREKHEFERRLARGRELLRQMPRAKTAEWTAWYANLPDDDQEAYGFALELQMTPPPPTDAQKGAAQVKPYNPNQPILFPATILTNYKPLLRVIGEMSVRPLRVETVRGPNGLISTMWADRADGSIEVDWGAGTVTQASVPYSKTGGGPSPSWVEPFMGFWGSQPDLVLKFDQNTWVKFRWTRNSSVGELAIMKDYQYAFGKEFGDASKTLESIVVADMQEKKIIGIIPVPPAKTGVHCIFDTKDNYLMVFDSGWDWIILFDLSKPNPDAPVPDAPRIEKKTASPGGAVKIKPSPPVGDALLDRAGPAEPDPEILKTKEKLKAEERLIQRGLELMKQAPPLGSKEWRAWYRALEDQDKKAYTLALDHGPKPGAPAAPGPKPLPPEPVPDAPRIEKK